MAQIKTNLQYGVTGSLQTASYSSLDATKLSGNLPALNASSLTNLDARDLENALPAISGASLTGITTGKVLQTVSATTTGSTSTTGTSYTTTNLTASITPASTSNKVLVLVTLAAHIQASTTGSTALTYPQFSLRRDTNTELAYQQRHVRSDGATSLQNGAATGFTYLDSPSTTSSMPYRVDMKNHSSYGGTIYINDGGKSSIVLLEIAG